MDIKIILEKFGTALLRALGYDEMVKAYGPLFVAWYNRREA